VRAGTLVLLHSPLVTAATWGRFPDELRARGRHVVVVAVDADDHPPYASRYVAQTAQQLAARKIRTPLVLVGHSGAGALLPQVAVAQRAARRTVGGYVFLDAVLPRPGADRLDLLAAEDAGMAADVRAELEAGARFPAWSVDDLVDALPDPAARAVVVTGMRPRGLDFFTEPLPHPDDWPDAPCGYVRTSGAYAYWERVATLRGWAGEPADPDDATRLPGHFAALRDPGGLADRVLGLLDRM
jgi:hypothetical protein